MTTSPSNNAEGQQVWNPSVGIYFNPAQGQRESYGGVVGSLQDRIVDQGGVNKAYPHNFAGIITAIKDLTFTQKEVPVTPGQKPNGGDVSIDSEGNPQWNVSVEPRNGELWFDTRQGRLFIAIDNEYYQTNGADGLATVTSTTVEPTNPVIGSFWWDITTSSLYIFDGYWEKPDGTIVGYWSTSFTPVWRLVTNTSTTFQASAVAITSGSAILREPAGSTLPALNYTSVNTQSQFNEWIYDSLEALETALESNSLTDLGVTASTVEVNQLDGMIATTTELNYLDGVTSALQSQIDNKITTGSNVNTLVGSTTPGTSPVDASGNDNYLFLVVNKENGNLVAVDKTFLEA